MNYARLVMLCFASTLIGCNGSRTCPGKTRIVECSLDISFLVERVPTTVNLRRGEQARAMREGEGGDLPLPSLQVSHTEVAHPVDSVSDVEDELRAVCAAWAHLHGEQV